MHCVQNLLHNSLYLHLIHPYTYTLEYLLLLTKSRLRGILRRYSDFEFEIC